MLLILQFTLTLVHRFPCYSVNPEDQLPCGFGTYSLDGKWIATVGIYESPYRDAYEVRLLDAKTGKLVDTFGSEPSMSEALVLDEITAVAFSHDSSILAVARRGSFDLWDINTHTLDRTLKRVESSTNSIAFSADDSNAVAVGSYGSLLVSTKTLKFRELVMGGDFMVFSPDGKMIATQNHLIKVWYLNSKEPWAILPPLKDLDLKRQAAFRPLGSTGGMRYLESVIARPQHGDAEVRIQIDRDNRYIRINGDNIEEGWDLVTFAANPNQYKYGLGLINPGGYYVAGIEQPVGQNATVAIWSYTGGGFIAKFDQFPPCTDDDC
jgi:hypothetical protein